jgi:hypothetical protein
MVRTGPNAKSTLKGRKDDTSPISKALVGFVESQSPLQGASASKKKSNKKKNKKVKDENGFFIPNSAARGYDTSSSTMNEINEAVTSHCAWNMDVEPKVVRAPANALGPRQGATPASRMAAVSSTTNQNVRKAAVLRIVVT